MKHLILFVIRLLMYLPGKVTSCGGLYFRWNLLVNQCYAALISHRFASAKDLCVLGKPVMIRGGQNIHLGKSVTLGKDCRLETTSNYHGQSFSPVLTIGDHAVVQTLCHIGCINRVEIGRFVTIAERTLVIDHHHGDTSLQETQLPPRERKLVSRGPIKIGDCVAIGENCIIMPGVTIGEHSQIGGGSVVTHDIPPYSVAVGNPARVIKTIRR